MSGRKNKKYNQLCKMYSKLLKTCCNEAAEKPWDSGLLLRYINISLEFMRDYYLLDEEVYTEDKVLHRFTTLLTATTAYNNYTKLQKNYYEQLQSNNKPNKKDKQAFLKATEGFWNAYWDTIKTNIREWYD